MIRDLDNPEKMKIKIVLKDNNFIIGDITSNPFGDNENLVSVWVEDRVRIFPIKDVSYIELFEE